MRTYIVVEETGEKFEVSEPNFTFEEGQEIIINEKSIDEKKKVYQIKTKLLKEHQNADIYQYVYVKDYYE
jgi:hypothetical protein